MILTTIFQILVLIWVILASIMLAVSAYRAVVWAFKKLNNLCESWEEWVFAILLIDAVLMMLVGILIMLFN